ncbi:carbohydrate sulfotransferase 1-like [Lytechinus pictus]|uniref:carbohydrate sulfotransferase 1-like n=1 Tax=Lytechinus pictus TaxID=7653 RepID=UPI0030BA207C
MALGEFMTRKWVKPFIAFFALTLASLLAFGSFTSRIGIGTMYANTGERKARTRMQKIVDRSRNTARFLSSPPLEGYFTPMYGKEKIARTETDNFIPIRKIIHDISNSSSKSLNSLEKYDSSDGDWLNQMQLKHTSQRTRKRVVTNISRIFSERTSPVGLNNLDSRTDNKSRRTKENVRPTTFKPVFIVLMGRMRTGSTLIGEIFNQNPSIGFLYEPLHAVCDWSKRGVIHKSHFTTAASTLLRKLSSCEFPPSFISSISKWTVGGGFRSTLIQPVCAMTNSCRHASSNMLRHQCLKFKKYRGIKTIRADLNMLHRLIEEDKVDVKILHLVRDPRGVANSRRQVYSVDSNSMQRRLAARGYRHRVLRDHPAVNPLTAQARKPFPFYNDQLPAPKTRGTRLDILGLMDTSDVFPLLNTIPAYCKWLDSTITLAQKKPDWLKGRYKLIRYEDYAASPLSVTEDVYRYFNMYLDDKVRRWVANNTEGNVVGGDILYGSHRNSSEAAFKWRTAMTSEETSQVETLCGDVMERLGYRKTSSRVRLDDLNHSLFLPIPDDIPREL